VLSHQLYRACLWAFLPHFLRKSYTRAHDQLRKGAIEYAVAMKINFLTVASFKKSKLAGRI